jgi:uncharacterized membrane-anchored protein
MNSNDLVAQARDPRLFKDIVNSFTDIVLLLVPVVAGIALLVFFWGLVKFIANVSGDAKAVADGRNLMVWGLIALFAMIAVWGILAFFSGELGFGPQLIIPTLPE